jgi:nickel-type superoxide dismutase maturation protease
MRARRIIPGVLVATGAALLLAPSLRRVEVTGGSMGPALLAGDRLVVVGPSLVSRRKGGGRWPVPGQVIAVRDPRLVTRVLVKRVAAVDAGADTITVLGDAATASTDSRDFGPVPRSAVVGRAVYRYAPPGRTGPGPWVGEYARR